jgi:hypothetical protein
MRCPKKSAQGPTLGRPLQLIFRTAVRTQFRFHFTKTTIHQTPGSCSSGLRPVGLQVQSRRSHLPMTRRVATEDPHLCFFRCNIHLSRASTDYLRSAWVCCSSSAGAVVAHRPPPTSVFEFSAAPDRWQLLFDRANPWASLAFLWRSSTTLFNNITPLFLARGTYTVDADARLDRVSRRRSPPEGRLTRITNRKIEL